MNIDDFKILIKEKKFEKYPRWFDGFSNYLKNIITYENIDLNLKCYLAELILKRSFYGTYTAWHNDVEWFIVSFFKEYSLDIPKPYLTNTIREAVNMVLSEETFTKGVIGTSFLFGVIEFYAKYKLGFRPHEFNFHDYEGKRSYIKKHYPRFDTTKRDLTLHPAITLLINQNCAVSNALKRIDEFTVRRLTEAKIESRGWHKHKIADRLSLARNAMLHGELTSFYEMGSYLVMLYILFHLCELSETNIQSTKKIDYDFT